MAGGPRRPRFYLGVLASGFVIGGLLGALLERFLPDSAARSFFTYAVSPSLGPVSVDLLVVSFTLGPVMFHVSILSLIGVAIAYYAARSLF
ncbi:MAG TPA: DUF4321 domain-containing protein [Gemmatimonadales bacterium]|nr:DUF4321 domain-containing protein [Gemmatimonadales bacterium]